MSNVKYSLETSSETGRSGVSIEHDPKTHKIHIKGYYDTLVNLNLRKHEWDVVEFLDLLGLRNTTVPVSVTTKDVKGSKVSKPTVKIEPKKSNNPTVKKTASDTVAQKKDVKKANKAVKNSKDVKTSKGAVKMAKTQSKATKKSSKR